MSTAPSTSQAAARADRKFIVSLSRPASIHQGRDEALKTIKESLSTSRATIITGPLGVGTSSLAAEAAHQSRDGFDYVYAFDCRGGLWPEEVLVRLSQFLSFHGISDLVSPSTKALFC